MIDASRASAGKRSGISSDESEGAVVVPDGEILGADGGDAVDVGKVVDLEVADFSGRECVAGFGLEDLVTAPGGEAVGSG